MKKVIFSTLLLVAMTSINAQNEVEKTKIKNVITTFFEGLHEGDSAKISATLHKDLKLQTTSTSREGKRVLRNELKSQFLKSIANKDPNTKYFEKLLSYDIKIDGNLASVWTPYEFYVNDNFSHCGANSFQMFNNNGSWEIIYLVDMRRREGCNTLESKK